MSEFVLREYEYDSDTTVLEVKGDIGAVDAAVLGGAIRTVMDSAAASLVVDVSQVGFVASAASTTLPRCTAGALGQCFLAVVTGDSNEIKAGARLFTCGAVPFFDTIEQALAALGR